MNKKKNGLRWKIVRNKVKELGKLLERIDGFIKHAGELIRCLWWACWVAFLLGGMPFRPLLYTPSRPRELPIGPPQIIWCNGVPLESSLLEQSGTRCIREK